LTSFWKNKAPRFPDKKMAVIPVIKGLRPFFCSQSSDAKYITPPVKQPALRFVDVQAAFLFLLRHDGIATPIHKKTQFDCNVSNISPIIRLFSIFTCKERSSHDTQYFNPLNHILCSPSVGLIFGQRVPAFPISPASGCFPINRTDVV